MENAFLFLRDRLCEIVFWEIVLRDEAGLPEVCGAGGSSFARRKTRRCSTPYQESRFCPFMAGAQWW